MHVTSDHHICEQEFLNCVLIYRTDLYQVTRVIRCINDEETVWRLQCLAPSKKGAYCEMGRAELKTLIDLTLESTQWVGKRVADSFGGKIFYGTVRGYAHNGFFVSTRPIDFLYRRPEIMKSLS